MLTNVTSAVIVPLHLLRPLCAVQPVRSILHELLNPGLQLRVVQGVVIHRSDPHNALSREASASTIQQGAADTAEVIGHCVASEDGVLPRELGHLLSASDVIQSGVIDDEVGGEHRGGEFVTVVTIADERVY